MSQRKGPKRCSFEAWALPFGGLGHREWRGKPRLLVNVGWLSRRDLNWLGCGNRVQVPNAERPADAVRVRVTITPLVRPRRPAAKGMR